MLFFAMPTLKSPVGQVLLPRLPVNRRTFNILRHEFCAFRVTIFNFMNPVFHVRVAALRKRRGLSLNIGTGGLGLPGWINTELRRQRDTTLCVDNRRTLPLASNSVRRILIEHCLEHVSFEDDAIPMLRDYHRILEPGGVLRIVVPDARRYCQAYAAGDKSQWQSLTWDLDKLPHDIYTPMHIVNHTFHQGGEHLFGYDFETLEWALKHAGFEKILRQSFQKSVDPELAVDQPKHAPYSLYVEAIR